jgi:TonB family protein
MKHIRINSLYIGIIISILIHIALFRIFRKEAPELPPPEKYEVNLFYYFPVQQEVISTSNKPLIKKRSVKKLETKLEVPDQGGERPSGLTGKGEGKESEENRLNHRELESEALVVPEEGEIAQADSAGASDYPAGVAGEPGQEEGYSVSGKGEIGSFTPSAADISYILDGLRQRILSERVYPPQARRRGIEGVVHLLISLDSSGKLLEVRVTRSSGYRVLDNAAVSLIKRVLPYEHGLGQPITFEIPIRYELLD